jgi:hypothetical protein
MPPFDTKRRWNKYNSNFNKLSLAFSMDVNSPYANSWILWWKPYFFVKKKDGSLWMCVDYHGLNWLTIKDRYSLRFILVLLDHLSHAKVYTKIDICGTYNLVHIRKGDEWKMKCRSCYGHFEYVVMPFGLTNMLVIFQHLMNIIFCEYLDDFVVCYIWWHLHFLKEHGGPWMPCKFGFGKALKDWPLHQIRKMWILSILSGFLGYIIFGDGIGMDPCKV